MQDRGEYKDGWGGSMYEKRIERPNPIWSGFEQGVGNSLSSLDVTPVMSPLLSSSFGADCGIWTNNSHQQVSYDLIPPHFSVIPAILMP